MKKRIPKTNLCDAMSGAAAKWQSLPLVPSRFSLSAFLIFVLAVCNSAPVRAQIECLPSSPVDCSASYLKALAPPVALYSEIFDDACLKHDYCYRFGATTYGYSKAKCDDDFYKDMKDICDPDGWGWGIVLVSAGTSLVACQTAAAAFYAAVKNLGDDAYQNAKEGEVCHYERVIGQDRRPLNPYLEYWILLF